MGDQADAMFSPGDIMRELRELRAEVEQVRRERRLEKASIGAGGLTLKGGFIRILDDDGDERARLSTEGLTLTQLLQILAGGEFLFDDGAGVRRVRISGKADDLEANISYRSGTGVVEGGEVVIGAIFHTDGPNEGELFGHGILVQQVAGGDLIKAWSIEGGPAVVEILDGRGDFVLQASDNFDQFVELHDDAGNARAIVGPVTVGGSPAGYGILVQKADGTDTFFHFEGETRIMQSDGTVIVRVDDTDGLRIAVPDGGGTIQSGQVTVGAADSAGAGFRTVRLPN